jgi:hypothetical protein
MKSQKKTDRALVSVALRKSFHFGLDVEAETITDDTHI